MNSLTSTDASRALARPANDTTRLKGIPGLLASLPLVFGSSPEPGLLLVLERASGVASTVRWNVDACTGSGLAAMLDHLAFQSEALGVTRCILIAYRCEPGAVDIEAVGARVNAVLDVHHVVTVTEAHWWATTCTTGCCDGALHALPTPDAASSRRAAAARPGGGQVGFDTTVFLAAWGRVSSVPAHASPAVRRARGDDLDVVLAALECPATRDCILVQVAPELFASATCEGLSRNDAGPSSHRPMSSRQMTSWRREIPPRSRPFWLALTALAQWREGDDAGAMATAVRARAGRENSLACLIHDIVAARLTYASAVSRAAGLGA